jgi:hypothetical protein
MGNRVRFGNFASNFENHGRLLAKMAAGQRATCFVNPDYPAESVLRRHGNLFATMFLALPLAFLLFIGRHYWRQRLSTPKRTRSATP